MKAHEQLDLIDRTPLGLWGDRGDRPADEVATPAAMVEPCRTPAKTPAPAPASPCLKCGKPSAGMFCNAKCKKAWQSGMNAWQAKMVRTRLAGEEEETLF